MQKRRLGNKGSRSRRSGWAAWACPTSTAGGTRRRRWPPSTVRSSSASTFLDTADMYGVGRNEELVGPGDQGPARRGRARDQVRQCPRTPTARPLGVNGRPDYVRSACEASLRRLGVEVIDLYYQHRVDPETPIEDTVGAMAELVRQGKVRFLGLSEAGAGDDPARACRPPDQRRCRPSTRCGAAIPRRRSCRPCASSASASSPTARSGRGFLTGQIRSPEDLDADDWRRQAPRFQGENFQRNLDLVARIEAIAAAQGLHAGTAGARAG